MLLQVSPFKLLSLFSVLACSAVGYFKAYNSPAFSVRRVHHYYVPEDTFDNSTEIMRVEAPVIHQYNNVFFVTLDGSFTFYNLHTFTR